MALPAKKVPTLSVVVVVILLLFSAASFLHSRSGSYGKIHIEKKSTWDDRKYLDQFMWEISMESIRGGRKYQTHSVLLRKHPNGGEAAMDDDKDARRRWYESFLPSTHTDSGERRLIHCYAFDVNGFLAVLITDEAAVLAHKPGIRSMRSDYLGPFVYSTTSCGFNRSNMKSS